MISFFYSRIRQFGATIVGVGVTDDVRGEFLRLLANFRSDVFTVADYDALGMEIVMRLVGIICEVALAQPGNYNQESCNVLSMEILT